MNCKDCKYWRRGGYFTHGDGWGIGILKQDENSKEGLCLHPSMSSDYIDGWLKRDRSREINDGVIAGCDEDRADLQVGENFGCVHFEQKNK